MFKEIKEKYYIKKMLALIEKYEFITEKISERLFLIKDVDGVLVEIYFNPKGFLQYLIINEGHSWHPKLGCNVSCIEAEYLSLKSILKDAIHNFFGQKYVPEQQLWNEKMFNLFYERKVHADTILKDDWWKLRNSK